MVNCNFNPFPALKTSRLKLRKITKKDVNEIFFLRSDARVLKYLDRDPAKSKMDSSNFIKSINDAENHGEGITWGIAIHDNPLLIGTIGFWRIQKEHYRAEIGYVLHPDWVGSGIISEAIRVVINFGFDKMMLHSIEANVNPQNIASIRLLEKHNFKREGYFKENFFYKGKFLDTSTYSLLSSEFEKL